MSMLVFSRVFRKETEDLSTFKDFFIQVPGMLSVTDTWIARKKGLNLNTCKFTSLDIIICSL